MRTVSLLLAVVGALGLLPGAARAYVVMKSGSLELRWASLPMKFNIHTAPAPGLTAATTQAAIRAAYQTWSTVSCTTYRSQDTGLVNLPWGDHSDHVNTHSVTPSWPSNYDSNALGITWTQYDPSSGIILDADTHYNPTETWAVNGSALAIDLQSVATHEIGHQLGLDHSPLQAATMFYATGAGDTSQRSLDSDDIAGVCHIYPSGQPLPPECTSPDHCAPNETCQSGKCVPATQKGYGSPCVSPKECQSAICLQSGGNSFCSVACDSAPCPNGDQCLTVSGGGNISKACLAGSGSWATKKLGEACKVSTDCKTSLCSAVQGKGYLCVQKCDRTKQDCPSSFACDESSLCVPADPQQAPPPDPTPSPTEIKKIGAACASSAECESGLCAQDGARKVCAQICATPGTATGCAVGYHCAVVPTVTGGCLKGSPTAFAELGEACAADAECRSKLCFDDGQGSLLCSALCDPAAGCDSGFDCVAQGDQQLCLPHVEAADGGKGCALSPVGAGRGGAAGGLLLLLLGLALALLLAARRSCR